MKNVLSQFIRKSNPEKIYTEIFTMNHWNSDESHSGTGSTLDQTKTLRQKLDIFFVEYQIKSILDIPCGDFNWMQTVNLDRIKYFGADIVKPLIKINKIKNQHLPNCKFFNLDITKDKLPKVDVILVRDCFVHLSYSEINLALINIRKSQSKYLLTTTFTKRTRNEDSILGGWRTLNLQIEPFNFSKPIMLINEECTEGEGEYDDKCLGLWLISK